MDRVKSKDGTSIAYDRHGRGPAVILVGGALDDGSENAPLAKTLTADFTVSTTMPDAVGEPVATRHPMTFSARSRI
jgi:hypothetical protein